ncbi:hypothetical protein [Nonomuraea insulae]|uniref:Uncharacterized protein n=1 Tax=Nonomuraea insulae TaxID=1616787 RepID=A0ABW1CSX3_9ACTN
MAQLVQVRPVPARGLSANVCGQVRLALLEARPAGLTARQLVAATGLSLFQVRKGILYIREVSAMANLTPLIWTYASGYAFASMPDDWIVYERSHLRTELTRIGRFLSLSRVPRGRQACEASGFRGTCPTGYLGLSGTSVTWGPIL